jgi:glycine oxidase
VKAGCDVAVVGAGIVGAAIAWECASRGARVALLDRGEPGCGASGVAAGMLAPCSEVHEAGPFLLLARASLASWPAFAERLREESGIDPELALDGLLRVALDDEAAAGVQAQLAWQERAGISAGEWIDARRAAALEPALSDEVAGAAWYPGEGHVHSAITVRALVAAARRRGVEVRSGVEVVGTARGGSGVALRDGEDIAAGAVVLAAGARLSALCDAFGGTALPVRPVHGQLVALRGLSNPPRHVLYAGAHGYVVAKRDGTVLAGATEEDRGFETAPSDEVTDRLHQRAQQLFPAAATAASRDAFVGLRPATPDHLPLLGRLPDAPGNVYVAGGHHRNGVLLAPETARGMAEMVLDSAAPPAPGWEAFDPARFA